MSDNAKIRSTTPGYLCSEDVKRKGNINRTSVFLLEVICYDNGLYKICPDPRDKHSVDGCRENFNTGIFISSEKYYINPEDLPENKLYL